MDTKRARDIASSPVMVDVLYKGKNIYIDSVDETKRTAHVHYLDEPYHVQEVSINNLLEH